MGKKGQSNQEWNLFLVNKAIGVHSHATMFGTVCCCKPGLFNVLLSHEIIIRCINVFILILTIKKPLA